MSDLSHLLQDHAQERSEQAIGSAVTRTGQTLSNLLLTIERRRLRNTKNQEENVETEDNQDIISEGPIKEDLAPEDLQKAKLELESAEAEALAIGDMETLSQIKEAQALVQNQIDAYQNGSTTYSQTGLDSASEHDPGLEYDRVSKGIEEEVPCEKDEKIALTLMAEGADPDFVRDVLAHSPQIQNINDIGTPQEANKYIEMITNSSVRRAFLQEHGLDRSKQKSKTKDLEL